MRQLEGEGRAAGAAAEGSTRNSFPSPAPLLSRGSGLTMMEQVQ